jgi:hypothetical protein
LNTENFCKPEPYLSYYTHTVIEIRHSKLAPHHLFDSAKDVEDTNTRVSSTLDKSPQKPDHFIVSCAPTTVHLTKTRAYTYPSKIKNTLRILSIRRASCKKI